LRYDEVGRTTTFSWSFSGDIVRPARVPIGGQRNGSGSVTFVRNYRISGTLCCGLEWDGYLSILTSLHIQCDFLRYLISKVEGKYYDTVLAEPSLSTGWFLGLQTVLSANGSLFDKMEESSTAVTGIMEQGITTRIVHTEYIVLHTISPLILSKALRTSALCCHYLSVTIV